VKSITYEELRKKTDELMKALSGLIDHSMAFEAMTVPMPVKDKPTSLPSIPYRNKPLKEKKPVGVLILHGFTSHVACVSDLRFAAQELGLPYRVPVLRGHGGQWEDLTGVTAEDWYEDAENTMLDLLTECQKVVVVGLSMGGLVAIDLAVRHRHKVAGLVTIAAALKFKDPLAALTPAVAKVVASWKSPNAYQDQELARQRNKNYPKFPTQAFVQLYDYAGTISNRLSFVHAPTLVLGARKDQIVSPKAAETIFKRIPSKDKRLVWFDETGHEMLLDLEAEKVKATVASYLRELAERK
jgi:carboxylesterase